MTGQTRQVEKYLMNLEQFLVCGKSDRARLKKKCGEMLKTVCGDNPEADYDGLVEAMGPPSEFARILCEELDSKKLNAARMRRRVALVSVLACVFLALAGSLIHMTELYREACNFREEAHAEFSPPRVVTEAEFEAFMKRAQAERMEREMCK